MKLKTLALILISTFGFCSSMGPMFPNPDFKAAAGGGCSDTDNFTAANGTALATHNANWSTLTQTNGAVGNCEIQSNEVRTTGPFNTVCSAMYTPSSCDNSSIVFKPYNDGTLHKGVCVRGNVDSGTNKTGYCAELGTLSGGNWTGVNLLKGGGFLDGWGISVSSSTSHTVKVTASGTSSVLITVIIDGSTVGTHTDSSSPYGTGTPGFYMNPDGDTTITGMDDWSDAP